ncbi:FtsX-like permease family protein [Shewanella khirikhana]|uniref:ABC transporter permease n=1 Tax=Shewanella khirikhana TaxID=1965282 RepID=UPI0030CC97A5
MLHNYLITALRSFDRHKLHFILNVCGLGIGLAAAMLIALYANLEGNYDKQQPHTDSVWRVEQYFSQIGAKVPLANQNVLNRLSNLPGIEALYVLESRPVGDEYRVDGNSFKLDAIMGAEPNIRELLNIEVLDGNLEQALTAPDAIALSRSNAIKLFGSEHASGKTLQQGEKRWTVAAVFADLPQNTHFAFNGLVQKSPFADSFRNNNGYAYLRVTPGTDIDALTQALQQGYLELAYPGADSNIVALSLERLTDIHLNGGERFEMKTTGSRSAIYICIGLSVLLVLLAGFNFVNMSIAQSARRAKEVGVRKAMGAGKGQIVSQFLTESVLTTLIAALLACVLVELSLPWFNQLVERELTLNYLSMFGLGMLAVVLVTGLAAGAYPALFMAAFSAKRVLSGDLERGKTAIAVRKTLLTLQSGLSVALIIGAVLLQQQLQHLQTLPVGYRHEGKIQVVDIDSSKLMYTQNSQLLQRVRAIDGVKQVGVVDIDITNSFNSSMELSSANGVLANQSVPFIGMGMDASKLMGLELIAGRDFSNATASDWFHLPREGEAAASALLTESLARQAGFQSPEDAIGATLTTRDGRDTPFTLTVVGVVKDIRVGSARGEQAAPIIICGYTVNWYSRLVMDIDMQKLPAIRDELGTVLGQAINMYAPAVEVLSQNYAAIYRNDAKIVQLVGIFSVLAIVLACFGTFGLASFSALRRQKEVSVRKVLGASRISIVNLLAREFLTLVAISVALAFPLTFYLVGDWLGNFNERIDQSLWVYLLAATAVAAITWITVASIAFKAASSQPAQILRYE